MLNHKNLFCLKMFKTHEMRPTFLLASGVGKRIPLKWSMVF